MQIAEIILRYLQVILVWPVVVFVLGIIFLKWFKSQISDFFQRKVLVEAYGFRIEAIPSEQRKEAKEGPLPKSQEEIERYISDHPKEMITEYIKFRTGYQFERTFNIIYGTQIDLLEHLSQKGSDGDKYINLIVYYNEFTKRSKKTSVQMADYIGFLKDGGFIEIEAVNKGAESIVKITPQGVNFLSYIKTQYSLIYKFKSF